MNRSRPLISRPPLGFSWGFQGFPGVFAGFSRGQVFRQCKMYSIHCIVRSIQLTVGSKWCQRCTVMQNIIKCVQHYICSFVYLKSRIRETPNLSTDANIRTNTILKRLRDLSIKKRKTILGKPWENPRKTKGKPR